MVGNEVTGTSESGTSYGGDSSTGDGDGESTVGDGDGDSGDGDGEPGETSPPSAAVLDLNPAQPKLFKFSWAPVLHADYYRLLEKLGPGSEFVQVGEDIYGLEQDLIAPLVFRKEASYSLQACNAAGCSDCVAVHASSVMNDAIGYLKASNTNTEDHYGRSLSLSGDGTVLAVGAYGEDGGSINGNQGSNTMEDAGAVYLYGQDTPWDQPIYLKASTPSALAYFGTAVALSGDGTVLAVGARGESSNATGLNGDEADDSMPESGAVYIFVNVDDSWIQQAYIKSSNTDAGDGFGSALALSIDGKVLAVGAPFENSASRIINNGRDDNNAENAGAVYMFVRSGDDWSEQAYVKAENADVGDQFGVQLSLSDDGERLAVGANREDGSDAGDPGDNSTIDAGAAYLFDRNNGNVWAQTFYLKASYPDDNDWFGLGVSLSGDGATLAVGAQHEDSAASGIGVDQGDNSFNAAGAAYVFSEANGTWPQQAYIKAPNPMPLARFGRALRLSSDGNILAVTAHTETSSGVGIDGASADSGLTDAGAAYVFTRDGLEWAQHTYIKASNTDHGDRYGFGLALAADGSTLAIGADAEDGSAAGLGGDASDNSMQNSGAVYLY
ncbi:hypothetical protein ENSA7_05310 [Enhygromyxa salina]|uniref:Integrin n=2 Tax=Enhygromyxa salina TaxID=215803 RepID=A0A2S9YXE5_9BACT|nr:hypothetical protein ENSA7_05310 [Enhygromyxa salina]